MIIPIRCFSCGKVVGNKWNSYRELLMEGVSTDCALDKLGLVRICCRRMLLTHVDLIDDIMQYDDKFLSKNNNLKKIE